MSAKRTKRIVPDVDGKVPVLGMVNNSILGIMLSPADTMRVIGAPTTTSTQSGEVHRVVRTHKRRLIRVAVSLSLLSGVTNVLMARSVPACKRFYPSDEP